MPQGDPVEVCAGVASRRLELRWKGLLLDGDNGDVVAEAPGPCKTRNGNRPLPAIDQSWDMSGRIAGSNVSLSERSRLARPRIPRLLVNRGHACASFLEGCDRSSVVFLSRAAAARLALVGSACDNGPETPTIPNPVLVTETFTGTVTLDGAINHGFNVSGPGPTTAEITAIDPAGSFSAFDGTWSGVVCTAVLSNEAGTLASVLNGITQSAAACASSCTTRTASWSTRPSPTRSR